ncbi:beta-defensin 19-like [Arvicola amphibius]|uniref:beta-defensin 19-like n=1 Tax=Arvicola amphibius TaxID=1047088 RepID=UPI001C096373|nr:beta-defensin 19-like [Arvicola amphibius]
MTGILRSQQRALDPLEVTDDYKAACKNPVLQCMGNRGFCRSTCKKDEQPYFYCRTYQTCCLQPYVRISLASAEDTTNWSYEKHWPKIP